MASILRLFVFILMIPVFGSSYFILTMTGSFLGLEADWKDRLVFTPVGTNDPQQIYLVDKLIYAFPFHPLLGIACVISFLILTSLIILVVIKKFRHSKQ